VSGFSSVARTVPELAPGAVRSTVAASAAGRPPAVPVTSTRWPPASRAGASRSTAASLSGPPIVPPIGSVASCSCRIPLCTTVVRRLKPLRSGVPPRPSLVTLALIAKPDRFTGRASFTAYSFLRASCWNSATDCPVAAG